MHTPEVTAASALRDPHTATSEAEYEALCLARIRAGLLATPEIEESVAALAEYLPEEKRAAFYEDAIRHQKEMAEEYDDAASELERLKREIERLDHLRDVHSKPYEECCATERARADEAAEDWTPEKRASLDAFRAENDAYWNEQSRVARAQFAVRRAAHLPKFGRLKAQAANPRRSGITPYMLGRVMRKRGRRIRSSGRRTLARSHGPPGRSRPEPPLARVAA